ncbi:uncharacterized protein [Eleutherodactylus coqui]|uniref:uncharacterized protein n=1 Tax=Eleutherodactylus coqui TaxID=57060 RepID=UPI0034624F31
MEDTNLGVSAGSHQPRRASRKVSQEKEMKSGNIPELPKDKKEVMSGGGVLKGKVQYSDKAHSRKNDRFSGTHSTVQMQDSDHQSSTENLEQDKDSLNQKITELLDHLVRAQSTICALEKLNVSSLLRNLPGDMLESMKDSCQGPNIDNQIEGPQNFKTSHTASLQTSCVDICSGDLKCNREESKEEGNPAPRLTAFTPWSPRRQRSFPVLHTLYTSTESECSLEDTLPACKLLSPRFPNLGESFSDDRNDGGNSDISETKPEQEISKVVKPSLPIPSLLPIHRIPQQNHNVRASSSESSGEDTLINWVEMRSQDSALDYMSAQKILDTLLGLTTPSDRFAVPETQNVIEFSSKTEGHAMRSEVQLTNNPKGNPPTNDLLNMPYTASNQNDLYKYIERCSQPDSFVCSHYNSLHSPNEDLNRRLQSSEFITPPLPAKRSVFSGNFADTGPLLNSVGEVGFHSLRKNESTVHHKSAPSSLSIHDHPSDPPGQCIPFVLRSPSGSESIMGTWEGQYYSQEGVSERKSKKERTVTFHTIIDDGQPKPNQVRMRSKFMSHKFGEQGPEDDSPLDSTLL